MAYMIQQLEKSARAIAKDMQVSTKQCLEICNFLRGKMLEKSMEILERVIEKDQAIPYKRFMDGVGHRAGNMAAGRYPIKAAAELLELFKNVKANATAQGLTGELKITHLAANRASRPMRNRLKYRGEFKRTHVEIIVTEIAPAPAKPASKKQSKTEQAPKAAEEKTAEPKKIESSEPAKKTPEKIEKKQPVEPKTETPKVKEEPAKVEKKESALESAPKKTPEEKS